MKAVLFIGHHKVGSSSLQSFLAQNYLALLRAGILYPSVESEGFSSNIAVALRGHDLGDPPRMNVREPHNALAFRMMSEVSKRRNVPPYHPGLPRSGRMLEALTNQIKTLTPDAVVLCAEVFANFAVVDPALIDRLKAAIDPAKTRLLATLRRPDDYLVSWQGQRLKFGHAPVPLRAGGLEAYLKGIHFDYRRMLEAWTTAWGEAEIRLRTYADVLDAGGSVEDFRAQSDLRWPHGLTRVSDANPSLPYALMEIARRGNAMLAEKPARAFRDYLMEFAGRATLAANGEIEMYGADVRSELLTRFAPIHDWLGEISGRRPFFTDLDEARQPRPIPEMDAAVAALAQLKADAKTGLEDAELRAFVATLDLDCALVSGDAQPND